MTWNLELVNGMGSLKECDLPTSGDVCPIPQTCLLKMNMSSSEPEILETFTQFVEDI